MMDFSIKLDYKLEFCTVKINDIISDAVLATEFDLQTLEGIATMTVGGMVMVCTGALGTRERLRCMQIG